MKTLILQGIAMFAFLFTSAANAADTLTYDSLTEVGDRIVLDSPYLKVGGWPVRISSVVTSGLCWAYGLGKTVSAEPGAAKFARYAEFDKGGKLIEIGPVGSDTPVLSLICLKP